MNTHPKLNRALKLPLLTLYGIGTILGAGIYALIGKVAGVAGSLAPLSFVVSAFLALLTAYSYSQLVRRFPRSAGEAEYVYQGFGSLKLSLIMGWAVAFTGVVSAATLATGFVGYFQVFLPLPSVLVMVGVVAIVTLVAVSGIKGSAWMAAVITVVEVIGLILVCSVGFGDLLDKNFLIAPMYEKLSWGALHPVASGAFLAFYAFIGFEDMVNLAEETKDPQKTLPISIYISLGIAAVFYILVSLVAVSSLPPNVLENSSAPLADMYARNGGDIRLLSAIGMIAIVNGLLAQVIMSSRILYGLRHETEVLKVFSRVSSRTQTPVVATVMVSFVILLLVGFLTITALASLTSFIILIVFGFVNMSLILVEKKSKKPRLDRILVPTLAILLNTALIVLKLVGES